MKQRDKKYLDGVIRRWLDTLAPRGFAEAKRINKLNAMTLQDDTPVLASLHDMCAICLGNGYILTQANGKRQCRCQPVPV